MTRGILGEPLRIINKLLHERLILEYAIAGGVATLYYTEPVLTYDFDVMCRFPCEGTLIDPSPVFARLKEWGFKFGTEDRVTLNGVPVQFIPASPGLMEEALNKAMPVSVCGVKTRILRAEYLAAIMLKLYRPKDRAKLDLLVGNEGVVFDKSLFLNILGLYKLAAKWRRYNEA
ncbi:MAG: hypothetical protein WCL16_03255 [bacterium]